MIIHRNNPQTSFDTETGFLVREGDNKPQAPELIDCSVTDRCPPEANCSFCYMCATPDAKESDPEWIIQQLRTLPIQPFQIALGGGEPSVWSGIYRFVNYCKENNIVVNSAFGPGAKNDVVHNLTRDGLSAVGISYVFDKPFFKTVEAARGGKSQIFAHCILRADQIDYLVNKASDLISMVDGIIFLLFKPSGRAKNMRNLVPTEKQISKILKAYDGAQIGFDACCYNAIKDLVSPDIIEGCDGGKYSLFLDATNKTVSRCSFLSAEYDLTQITLNEAWEKIGLVDGCNFAHKGMGN